MKRRSSQSNATPKECPMRTLLRLGRLLSIPSCIGLISAVVITGCDLGTYAKRVEEASASYQPSDYLGEVNKSRGRRDAASLDNWAPDAALVSKLGKRGEFVGYTMQPPVGFSSTPAQSQGPQTVQGWGGPRNAAGVASSLTITILKPPSNEKLPALSRAMAKFIGGIKQRRVNWHESKPIVGAIDGSEFMKKTWTGTEANQRADMNGIMYVGIVDDRIVALSIQDVSAEPTDAMKLAEAAALTFKLKN